MLKNVTKPVQIVAERAEAQDDTQELVPERGAVRVVWEYFGFEKNTTSSERKSSTKCCSRKRQHKSLAAPPDVV